VTKLRSDEVTKARVVSVAAISVRSPGKFYLRSFPSLAKGSLPFHYHCLSRRQPEAAGGSRRRPEAAGDSQLTLPAIIFCLMLLLKACYR